MEKKLQKVDILVKDYLSKNVSGMDRVKKELRVLFKIVREK